MRGVCLTAFLPRLKPWVSMLRGFMRVYHITESKNINKILKNGLKPRIGKYAKKMGEYEPGIWLFKTYDDAEEMLDIWMKPFYEEDLVCLQIDLPDNYPVEYTGSDYEVVGKAIIHPKYFRQMVIYRYTTLEDKEYNIPVIYYEDFEE